MMTRPIRTVPALALLVLLTWPSVSLAGSADVALSATGTNGTGHSVQPGVACAEGGTGASWVYDYSATLPGGAFTSVPGVLRLRLEPHSEALGDPAAYSGAWLHPGQSFATIENGRGALRLALASGAECGVDTMSFDGTTVSGRGTWIAEGSGSYRQATGAGAFELAAQLGAGADNPFQIQLDGSLSVLDPSLGVEVVQAVWEHGTEGASRHALVTYAVSNTGPGDSFGAKLLANTTSAPDIVPVEGMVQTVGDLAEGASALVQVRYRLDRARPCKSPDRGCAFLSTLSVDLPDALDNAMTVERTVEVRIPTRPQG